MKKNLLTEFLLLVILTPLIFAQSWEPIESVFHPEANYVMYAGTFASENQGWWSGWDDGRIWHTSDGGYNWYLQKDSSEARFWNFYFADTLRGLALGKGIWRTLDGGKIWTDVGFTGVVSDNFFFDSLKGFITTSDGGIFKTNDGGVTWKKTNLDIPDTTKLNAVTFTDTISMGSIYFINDTLGYAAGGLKVLEAAATYVFKSTDGGDNWQQISKINLGLYNQIYFTDENKGFILGRYIFHTEDGGKTWNNVSSYKSIYSGLDFSIEGIGWAVDAMGQIFNSLDAGRTWNEYQYFGKPISQVLFLKDKNIGYCFGNDRRIYKYEKPTSVSKNDKEIPNTYILKNNYPNPFNPTTTIGYEIPEETKVKITIYNLLGKEIKTLINKTHSAGSYSIIWDGTDNKNSKVASGVYIYSLKTSKKSLSKKMILLN